MLTYYSFKNPFQHNIAFIDLKFTRQFLVGYKTYFITQNSVYLIIRSVNVNYKAILVSILRTVVNFTVVIEP